MRFVLTALALSLFLLDCGSKEAAETKTEPTPAPSYVTDEALFVKASQNLTGQFGRNLKSELMAALNSYGAPYALQVCQIKAPEIAASHSKGGWWVKRVSDRYRNPDDRPINDEADILAKFADTAYHQDYYQDWYGTDSNKVFRFCQKIVAQPMCLQCHGDLQTINSDLYKQIKIAYPWDKATGYKTGDLRGMFVVEASWPEGRDVANLLAAGVDITTLDSTQTDTAAVPFDSTEETPSEDTVGDGQGGSR